MPPFYSSPSPGFQNRKRLLPGERRLSPTGQVSRGEAPGGPTLGEGGAETRTVRSRRPASRNSSLRWLRQRGGNVSPAPRVSWPVFLIQSPSRAKVRCFQSLSLSGCQGEARTRIQKPGLDERCPGCHPRWLFLRPLPRLQRWPGSRSICTYSVTRKRGSQNSKCLNYPQRTPKDSVWTRTCSWTYKRLWYQEHASSLPEGSWGLLQCSWLETSFGIVLQGHWR